jgi:hypothetical protein
MSIQHSLNEILLTFKGMNAELMTVTNPLVWDNAQAWISLDDLYRCIDESEAILEAIQCICSSGSLGNGGEVGCCIQATTIRRVTNTRYLGRHTK